MKFNSFLIINAIVALVFGIGFVFMPATMATIYGITQGPAVSLLGQFFGVELIAVGLLCWFSRNISDAAAQRAMILSFLIADASGVVISLMGTLSGVVNAVGWSSVTIYLLLTLGYVYFQFKEPGAA